MIVLVESSGAKAQKGPAETTKISTQQLRCNLRRRDPANDDHLNRAANMLGLSKRKQDSSDALLRSTVRAHRGALAHRDARALARQHSVNIALKALRPFRRLQACARTIIGHEAFGVR